MVNRENRQRFRPDFIENIPILCIGIFKYFLICALPLEAVSVIQLFARNDTGDRVDAVPAAAFGGVIRALLLLALLGQWNGFQQNAPPL